ncbi:ATP-binding cassette domain-containing protein [Kitasatospora sp. GP82]|uniref:ATP-binding cassette domain-containing protein n=1 Tax=Kitasatospora sp. GP82 TaxID=3035089 RepID=UPI00247457EB|nr:ATP-binding cassette domain-containing protein [Kitasatospora sp. GP82]MDH6123493.1 ABC-2 type transport system ATP-binding protein [Kitasatospora sp. GP82]
MNTTTSRTAIEVSGLRKTYGKQVVLDGIGFEVQEGTVFSLLGPNGAGKTTTVQILTTLHAPDGGAASIMGHDTVREADAVRRTIGVTGQFSAVDTLLTGEENLQLMADLHHFDRKKGRRRVAELLEQFDLVDARKKPPAQYSGGMKRRLDLAMTLVAKPRVIFLDEPTTGLDPRSRRSMWQAIRELVDGGVTVFLTTQYLEEADQLADRIAVLNGGSIVAHGTSAELKQLIPGSHVRLHFADANELALAASAFRGSSRDDAGLTLSVPSDGSIGSLRTVLDRVEDSSIDAQQLTVHTPDLDDVFFALTGEAPAATGTTGMTDTTEKAATR